MKRFFINNIILQKNSTYELTKDEYNYIVNVMRLRQGDEIVLNNNTEYDFFCVIKEVQKNKLVIEVKQEVKNKNEPKINLTVCQALVKGDKFELITQKIVELGANALIPFTSTFTVVKDNTQKTERLQKIAEQASSQCGRSKTLQIEEIVSIKNLPSLLKEYDLVLLAYENDTTSLSKTLTEYKTAKNIALIVGSEGGFSVDEVEFLKANVKNIKTVSLGSRILRAETASIALTTVIMYELGELS